MERLNEYQRDLMGRVRAQNGVPAARRMERAWMDGRNPTVPSPNTVVVTKSTRRRPVLKFV